MRQGLVMFISPYPDREPFVYIIKNLNTGIKYAGVKFSKGCKPSDLLTKYFTSSKVVKRLISEGDVFVIEKIIRFDTKDEAIEFEEFLLQEVNAPYSSGWYNQAIGKAIDPDVVKQSCLERYGVNNWMLTEEAKLSGLGFKEGNTFGCFTRSEETKMRMSIAFTGRVFSDEHRNNLSKTRIGKTATQETKDKMAERKRGVPRPDCWHQKMKAYRESVKDIKHICPYCNRESSNKGVMARFHFENCKLKPKELEQIEEEQKCHT